MRQAKKIRQALKRRREVWDNLSAMDMIGPSTKKVREPNGMAYHKPGSQNRRKGSSGRRAHR